MDFSNWRCTSDAHLAFQPPTLGKHIIIALHVPTRCDLPHALVCCDQHHDQNQLREERVYLASISPSEPVTERSQYRNSRLDIWMGGMGACCLLACSSGSLPSYSTQDHRHIGGTTHTGLGPPISIIDQERALHAWLQASIQWSQFLH